MSSGKLANGTGRRRATPRTTPIAAPMSGRWPCISTSILRPPNHPQLRLANAQVDWLGGVGTESGPTASESGWTPLGASGDNVVLDAAITAANAGKLVIARYFQPPTEQPDGTQTQGAGHICVVRPQDSFPSDEGPQVATPGVQNFKSASMMFAFGDHPLAWPDNIQLFVDDTALE
jgi:hypothetical protein